MITVYQDNIQFLNQYEKFLLNDEIQYSLMLGLSRKSKPTFKYITSIIDTRFLIGVLAGKNLILASNTLDNNVYKELIDYMDKINYPGVIGTRHICEKYNELYQLKYDKPLSTKMNQRIYKCEQVLNFSQSLGTVRKATEKDVELLKYWLLDFYSDVEDDITLRQSEESILDKINKGILYVLEINDEIVSMTTRTRSIKQTESVSYVYTPHNHRRKGYASRLVEEITMYILRDGKIATLYTDLDNPTSNSIYMKIGYVPYCDSVMLNKVL